jgi:succinate dehydrogenase / fumarate reductase, cytochrome b subunit
VKDKRPVNLNLFTIHFPLPAIVSILHRITGVILFLMIPFMIWGLDLSLATAEGFDEARQFLLSPVVKFLTWCILSALIFHTIAGIRHIIMDMGIGESLKGGKLGAQLTLIISIIFIVLAGIWLW